MPEGQNPNAKDRILMPWDKILMPTKDFSGKAPSWLSGLFC